MKHILILAAFAITPLLAQAGDNGSYTQCKSASGRTVLEIGTVGSGANPRTVELKIDNKSYGAAEIDEAVIETVKGNIRKYTEADHDGADWVTIKVKSETKVTILSGLDPRNGQPLKVLIEMTCKEIYNPI